MQGVNRGPNISNCCSGEPKHTKPTTRETEIFKICASCDKTDNKKFLRCSRCKVINYCDATCQKADWISHKLYCKMPVEGKATPVRSPVELEELFESGKRDVLQHNWLSARMKLEECLSQTRDRVLRMETHNMLGQCISALGIMTRSAELRDLSVRHFEAGVQIADRSERGLLVKGFCLSWLNKPQEAIDLSRQVLKNNPGSISAYVLQLKVYENIKDPVKILETRMKLAELEGKSGVQQVIVSRDDTEGLKKVLKNNGFFDLELGEYEVALDEFNEFLSMVPDDIEGLYGAGCCLERLGRKEEAQAKLLKVQELDPNFRDVKEILDRLSK